MFDVIIDPLKG